MKQIPHSKPLHGGDWETSSNYILPDGTNSAFKPESMTQLLGNLLVYKDDPRIILRGKLDTFQSELLIFMQKTASNINLISQLNELLLYSRTIIKHEVLNTPIPDQSLLSWNYEEIRTRSHNPDQYYGLDQMVLLDITFSEVVLKLNLFRAKIREIELIAVQAFRDGENISRNDIILALNRMSSCFHILMYQEIAHNFKK